MRELYSPSRRKSFRRAQNKLERMGIVALEVHRCGTQHDVHSETFLELEAMGWKGDERSALLSQAREASFFRAMSRGFAASERAVFIELTLDGTPIFASSNYLSGTECFGFKSGWHPDYRDGSPGRQGELLTLASAPAEFHDIAVLDSCSEPGQYIDAVWPWRRRMSSRLFTATSVAHRASAVTTKLLRLKRRLTRNSTVRDS
jgi:CelD/BcsL family acetyltransferase involved in cellulose biosynthesis